MHLQGEMVEVSENAGWLPLAGRAVWFKKDTAINRLSPEQGRTLLTPVPQSLAVHPYDGKWKKFLLKLVATICFFTSCCVMIRSTI